MGFVAVIMVVIVRRSGDRMVQLKRKLVAVIVDDVVAR